MRERPGGLAAGVTPCLPTFLSMVLIVGPQRLPAGRVRNGEAMIFRIISGVPGKRQHEEDKFAKK